MLLFRVFPHLPRAKVGERGHPTYRPPSQGKGRLDNPDKYDTWYFALDEMGAVVEAFGTLAEWSEAMFAFPDLPGARRALATFRLEESTNLLELDDSLNLVQRNLRPTQVIVRIRPATQAWALRVFNERNGLGQRTWEGVQWWSYYGPSLRIVGYWGDSTPELVGVEPLHLGHRAVHEAARCLPRKTVDS
jgi:hypothetical protein